MDLTGKIGKIVSPLQNLIRDETNSSYLLLITTVSALVIANSPLQSQYQSLLHIPIGFHIDNWFFEKTFKHWVNDGLMALFFYTLGLEIKRELLVGELKQIKRSFTVIAAACGGMAVPAGIYIIFNIDASTIHGWGIPMATDTAFAIGILMLLKNRVPVGLAAFLTALAIIDDLGAIVVIAVFYTKTINITALVGAVGIFLLLMLINYAGIRRSSIYLTIGAVLWFMMEFSGVHSTIAGVLVALTVPARPEHSDNWVIERVEWLLHMLKIRREQQNTDTDVLANAKQHELMEQLEESAQKATTPLKRQERSLERPVILFVLPIFALVNAGIPLNREIFSTLVTDSASWGIILGLVLGKPVGITLCCWLSLKSGQGQLPDQISLSHILGMAMLGGIGFTMSIFIAGLSFSEDVMLISAKLSIFVASIISGILGYVWLRYVTTGQQSTTN